MQGAAPREHFYVVVFQDAAAFAPKIPVDGKKRGKGARPESHENERLKGEMEHLREQLRVLIEDHETTLEEFKAANEEVLSSNEELQSTNEELETAKEELQSSNEELTTLNEELQNRNAELTVANNDLLNLLGNVNIPVVIVGNDLQIRRFTPPAQKLLNLLPSDVGRRLTEIRPNLEISDLGMLIRQAIESITPQEREIRDINKAWYLLRIRPYKTADNKIDGAVVSFQDIDQLKRTLDQTRYFADALIENAREPILVLDSRLHVTAANETFYREFDVARNETEKRAIYDLGSGQWNIPGLRTLLADVLRSNTRVDDFEVRHNFPHIGPRIMLLNARRLEFQPGRQVILLNIEDVTQARKHEEILDTQAALLELAHDAIITRDLSGKIEFWNGGAREMYGWTKTEAVGKSIFDLLHTDFPKSRREIDEDFLRHSHWEGDLTHTHRDGTRKRVHSRWVLHQREGGPATVMEINGDAGV